MAWDAIAEQALAKRIFQTHLTRGRVAHAYLLSGPDGVGKGRLALEMAKALICCASGPRPCDRCQACGQVERSTHPDLHRLGPEGAGGQIKIEPVRYLLSRLALRPFTAPVQVAVIEHADRFSEEAANSLLKTLEEPSNSTRFVLTTTRLAFCLPTIVSRCQVIRCHALSPAAIARVLSTGHAIEPATATVVARLASGSVARALELAKEWAMIQEALARLASDDAAIWFRDPMPDSREAVAQLIDQLLAWIRDVLVLAAAEGIAPVHQHYEQALRQDASHADLDQWLAAAFELMALRDSIDQYVSPKLIAARARETWLSLTARNAKAGQAGT